MVCWICTGLILLVHETVTCDKCGQFPIIGTRYTCQNCPSSYDLCRFCYKTHSHKHSNFSAEPSIPQMAPKPKPQEVKKEEPPKPPKQTFNSAPVLAKPAAYFETIWDDDSGGVSASVLGTKRCIYWPHTIASISQFKAGDRFYVISKKRFATFLGVHTKEATQASKEISDPLILYDDKDEPEPLDVFKQSDMLFVRKGGDEPFNTVLPKEFFGDGTSTFDVSNTSCRPFGFLANDRIANAVDHTLMFGTVIGVKDNSLHVRWDGASNNTSFKVHEASKLLLFARWVVPLDAKRTVQQEYQLEVVRDPVELIQKTSKMIGDIVSLPTKKKAWILGMTTEKTKVYVLESKNPIPILYDIDVVKQMPLRCRYGMLCSVTSYINRDIFHYNNQNRFSSLRLYHFLLSCCCTKCNSWIPLTRYAWNGIRLYKRL